MARPVTQRKKALVTAHTYTYHLAHPSHQLLCSHTPPERSSSTLLLFSASFLWRHTIPHSTHPLYLLSALTCILTLQWHPYHHHPTSSHASLCTHGCGLHTSSLRRALKAVPLC